MPGVVERARGVGLSLVDAGQYFERGPSSGGGS